MAKRPERDERADEADRESFPASDPPSGWSGREDDEDGPTEPGEEAGATS